MAVYVAGNDGKAETRKLKEQRKRKREKEREAQQRQGSVLQSECPRQLLLSAGFLERARAVLG